MQIIRNKSFPFFYGLVLRAIFNFYGVVQSANGLGGGKKCATKTIFKEAQLQLDISTPHRQLEFIDSLGH